MESGFEESGWRYLDSRKVDSRSVTEILSFQSKAQRHIVFLCSFPVYEGWNFNSGNYLFTTDTK